MMEGSLDQGSSPSRLVTFAYGLQIGSRCVVRELNGDGDGDGEEIPAVQIRSDRSEALLFAILMRVRPA